MQLKKQNKIIIFILLTIILFLIGLYLRAYISLHSPLPYSPYEAFAHSPNQTEFTGKQGKYPVTTLINQIIPNFLKPIYLVYIFGSIIIFFLGKELTNKNLGGFLAFSIYSIAPENLLQYTKTISTSGLCYIFIWTALLFFIKYLKNKRNYNIILFTIFSLFALTSYHTGATAMIMISIGLLISIIYSNSKKENSEILLKINHKILASIIFLWIFYIFWIKIFDLSQLSLIINIFRGTSNFKILIILIFFISIVIILNLIKNLKFLQSEYIPLFLLIPSIILVFSKINFFKIFLKLGPENYYSSAITLNNYLAQALLTHSYVLLLLPILFRKNISKRAIFLRGWLIGLIIISLGLISANYYARIFDYSFPLIYFLFAIYWCEKKKFRKIIVLTTIILLIISQLMIYNDPFEMRRYYNQEEINSIQNLINSNMLPDNENITIASDLKTSALFNYLGKTGIKFSQSNQKLHESLFYNTSQIKNITFKKSKIDYIILSKTMKHIVYAMNFETTPITNKTFEYYNKNYEQIYNDNITYVYKIN